MTVMAGLNCKKQLYGATWFRQKSKNAQTNAHQSAATHFVAHVLHMFAHVWVFKNINMRNKCAPIGRNTWFAHVLHIVHFSKTWKCAKKCAPSGRDTFVAHFYACYAGPFVYVLHIFMFVMNIFFTRLEYGGPAYAGTSGLGPQYPVRNL